MVCQACIFGEVLKETGDIDWLQIAARGGVSVQQAQEHLSSIGLTFRNPRTHGWETSSAYLSGNLRAKLREAEAAAAVDPTFRANVEALR
jgi:N12 class adenine-specific DNA methylase